MNQCDHCEMSKIYVKKVLISGPSSSLPKGKYWKQHMPMNSIARAATVRSMLELTNQFQHVNLFKDELFRLALQNTRGPLTLKEFTETSSYYTKFLLPGGHWGLESSVPPFGSGCSTPQTTGASLSRMESKHQRLLPALEVNFKPNRFWVGLLGFFFLVWDFFALSFWWGGVWFFDLENLLSFAPIHYNVNTWLR